MKKRILSLFLALVMLFSCLSLNVFATEEQTTSGASEDGTVVTNTFTAHTDAQITSAIDALKTAGTNRTFANGTTTSGYTVGSSLKTENGKIVKYSGDKSETRIDLSSHTVLNGRNALKNFKTSANTPGASFVLQTTWNFTEFFQSNASANLYVLQITDYLATNNGNGYGSNPYILTADYTMPNLLMVSVVNGKIELYARKATTNASQENVPIMTLTPGVDYTFSVFVNPQDISEEEGIYGSYDVYVNGECCEKRINLFTKQQNACLTLDERTPYAQEDAWYTEKNGDTVVVSLKDKVLKNGATLYFFSETAPDAAELAEILEKCGITVKDNGTVNAVAMGRTKDGVEDLNPGFVRFHKTQDTYGETATDKLAYTFDNMIFYYANEFTGNVTDHFIITNEHGHDFTRTTTDVSYTCRFCYGKKVVAKTLDANGDKVCDLCIDEFDVGGTIPVSELGNYIKPEYIRYAQDFDTYYESLGTYFQGHAPYDFGDSFVRYEENGNGYIKYIVSQNLDDKSSDTTPVYKFYAQVYTTDKKEYSDVKTWPAVNFDEFAGKSYVISSDIKIEPDCTIIDMSPFAVMCYAKPVSDKNELTHAFNFTPVKFYKDGTLKAFNANTGMFDIDCGVVLTPGETVNLAIHHTPKTNTFDIYIDGVRIKSGLKAVTANQSNLIKYENKTVTVSGVDYVITSNGASDFIPSAIQFFQYNSTNPITTDAFCYDNLKFYYSDEFIECNHNYELTHTHNIEAGKNNVAYVCTSCGKTYSYTFNMTNHREGEILTPEQALGVADTSKKYLITSFSAAAPYGGLSTLGGGSNTIKSANDGDNYYLQYHVGASAYAQYAVSGSPRNYCVTNFNTLRGKSYVMSLDFNVDKNNKSTINSFFQVLSYLTSSDNGVTIGAASFTPLYISPAGEIVYKNAGKDVYSKVYVNDGLWHNATVYHTPAGDKMSDINTYDLYIDGVCIAENIPAVDSSTMKWKATSETTNKQDTPVTIPAGFEVSGPQDYIPTHIRTAQYTPAVTDESVGTVSFSIDNFKFYYANTFEECKHSYVGSVCEWCGNVEELGNYCDICMGTAISDEVAITGRSATLGELVDMNFYVAVNGALAKDENAAATVSCGNKSETIALKSAKIDGGYKFSLPLRSTQMASDVTIEIDGATYTTSIEDYALDLIEAYEAAAPVAKALLNYGAAAQTYFAVKNNDATLDDVLANAKLSEADKTVSALTADELNAYAFTQEGATADVHFTGAKLQLASKTHMLLYFTAPAGATVTVNGVKAYAVKDGDEYYVSFTAQTPTNAMTDEITATVTAGETTVTTTVNVFTAVAAGIEDGSNADLVHLLNAYAQYCKAAKAFTN